MPLVTLDHVSIAYGHVPLLDDASLQVEAGERVCVIGRNGTGKSTLLQIVSGEQAPDARHRLAAAGPARRAAGAGRAALGRSSRVRRRRRRPRRPRRAGGRLSPRRGGGGRARQRQRRSRGWAGCSTSSKSGTAGASSSAWNWSSRGWTCRPTRSSIRCRAAGGAACCWRARWSAQPDLLLLDEPTNHLDIEAMTWLETFLVDVSRRGGVRHARPRVPPAPGDADRRARSRPADVVARRLRDLSPQEGGVAGERGRAERRSSTSGWPRKRSGCARASRRGARANEGRVRALLAMRDERAARRER